MKFYDEVLQHEGIFNKMHHVQQRLNLGWGTTKVGISMALGQFIFERTRETLFKLSKTTKLDER